MPLVLEDGTGVATANALVERQALLDYVALYRPDLTLTDDAITDAAIVRASAWISSYPNWEGSMTYGRGNQGLSLPRKGMTDCNGDDVADDAIPVEAEHATFIAAIAEYETPGVLTPTIAPGEQQKRVKVDVIEVEFMTPRDQGAFEGTKDPVEQLRPVLTQIKDLLRCLASLPSGRNVPWPFVT